MVRQKEVAVGGGAAPGAAGGAATEEGFGGKTNEDLPDGDRLREAAVERRRTCSCGRRLGAHPGTRFVRSGRVLCCAGDWLVWAAAEVGTTPWETT
jgi:hypothetical protein